MTRKTEILKTEEMAEHTCYENRESENLEWQLQEWVCSLEEKLSSRA